MIDSQLTLNDNSQSFEQKLLEVLNKISFDKKYYQYYENHSNFSEKPNLKLDSFESALMSSSLDFKYNKKENFFGHKEVFRNHNLVFNIAFSSSSVELILSITVNESCKIGGPFSSLARKVAWLNDPNFDYSPRFPKLPFSNRSDLQDAVDFGISLFEEIKEELLVEDPF